MGRKGNRFLNGKVVVTVINRVVEKDWKVVATVAVEMVVVVKDWVLVAAMPVEVVVLVGTVAGIKRL